MNNTKQAFEEWAREEKSSGWINDNPVDVKIDLITEVAHEAYQAATNRMVGIVEKMAVVLEKARIVTDTAWEGELLKCWDGFRGTILEYPDCDLPRMCFENYFDDVNEDIVEALLAAAPFRDKGEW